MYITETNLLRKNNNFDLFRLLAAVFVFLSHCLELRGIEEDWVESKIGTKYLLSELGLIIFFTISGFLVCRSLLNVKSPKQYLRNRFLRIWPAFAVCSIVVFIAGIFLTKLPVQEFLIHRQSLQFLLRNLTALTSTHWLPGVFDNKAVNASIWTIPNEVRLYVLLLVIFLVTRLRFRQWLLLITIIGWLIMTTVPPEILKVYLRPHMIGAINQGLYFLAGSCVYVYKDKVPFKFSIWLALVAYWIILLIWFPTQVKKLQLPFFVYSTLWITMIWPKIPSFTADISYGFYLYAWPVQAIIQTTFGSQIGFLEYVLICATCISVLALLSWHFLEKRMLTHKYVPIFSNSDTRLQFSKRPENEAHGKK
jgi:peptidoglycan/LPS O-acetylase OafA/YrhL